MWQKWTNLWQKWTNGEINDSKKENINAFSGSAFLILIFKTVDIGCLLKSWIICKKVSIKMTKLAV